MTRKEYNAAVYASALDGALCLVACMAGFGLAVAAAVVML